MRRLLLATSALLLVAPDMAMAYQAYGPSQQTKPARPAKPGQRPSHPNRPSQGHRPGRPSIQPVRPSQGHRPGRPSIQPVRPRPPHARPPHVRPPTYRPGHRPPSFRPIHRPGFQYPRGWRYRHWRVGLILPALFLAPQYYISDYYDLGLGPPPLGYVWVRYGPDLLLVQRHTGRIVDVIYGAFY